MQRSSLITAALLVSLVPFVPAIARADVISPDESACQGKSAGDSCILMAGGTGACTNVTRSIGNPAADASVTILTCTAASDAGPATATDSATPSSDAATSTSTDAGTTSARSGCSVGDTAGRTSSFALAVCALAGAFAMRRRRSA